MGFHDKTPQAPFEEGSFDNCFFKVLLNSNHTWVYDKFHNRTLIVLIFMILTDKILHINKDQSNQFDQCTLILLLRWKFVVYPPHFTSCKHFMDLPNFAPYNFSDERI